VEEVAGFAQVIERMERETGLEPATSSLGSWHSTTELLPRFNHLQQLRVQSSPLSFFRANSQRPYALRTQL
jgi:hypothetical protein